MELTTALDFVRTRHRGVLVTLKADGRPQLSNVMYALADDGVLRVSVTETRAKTANARRDPRVSLYVTSDDFWSYAVVEGEAELTPTARDPQDQTVQELVSLYREISGEHPSWDQYRSAMVADRRMVLRLRPTYAYGMVQG